MDRDSDPLKENEKAKDKDDDDDEINGGIHGDGLFTY